MQLNSIVLNVTVPSRYANAYSLSSLKATNMNIFVPCVPHRLVPKWCVRFITKGTSLFPKKWGVVRPLGLGGSPTHHCLLARARPPPARQCWSLRSRSLPAQEAMAGGSALPTRLASECIAGRPQANAGRALQYQAAQPLAGWYPLS